MADVLIKVGTAQNNLVNMPNPSKLDWSHQRVSQGDSGRDDTGYMYVGQVTTKVKLALSWNAVSPTTAATILQAFSPEYLYIRYFDPMQGSYQVKQFYTGDMSAPVRIWTEDNKIYETISFDVIER